MDPALVKPALPLRDREIRVRVEAAVSGARTFFKMAPSIARAVTLVQQDLEREGDYISTLLETTSSHGSNGAR